MQEYQVQYHIEVFSSPAIEAINKFKTALTSLSGAGKHLTELQRQVKSVNDTLAGLRKQQLQLNTAHAKEQLNELLVMARELKATLAGTTMGPVRGGRGSRTTTSGQQTTAPMAAGYVGKTGHSPLTPHGMRKMSMAALDERYPYGWSPRAKQAWASHHYPNSTPSARELKRIDAQARLENQERYRQQKLERAAYNERLRAYRAEDIQRRWDARRAARTPEALAEKAARQARRLEYLRSNRDAILARHGITPEMRNAPIALTPDGKYIPSTQSAARWRPSGARNAYGSRTSYTPRQFWSAKPNNLTYKLLGPTPLPNNGGMAIDMLKGMGIAYGIAGIGSMFSNIVTQSAEYDNTMKTVENILKSHDQQGNFSGRFAGMTNTIRNVGMETKYTITEVADAAKFLAMAGLKVDAINQAIRPIADIALVGDTDLGETADLVTNIMTAYNIHPSQMRRTADIMTNTFTMSNTTLTEIAEAYKYSAALLSAGGVDFKESAAAIGVLGDAGIKGSQAGTTMRTLLANILNPTKKQRAAWDEVGIKTEGKSLVQIFQQLHDNNVSVDQFYRLFHKTAAQGAVALADHVTKWNEVIIENFLSDGMSSKLADEKKNTLQGLWAQLTSVFTDDGVKAFSGIQGTIREFLKSTINFLKTQRAQEMFQGMFKTFMEFGKIIVDVSKKFYGMWEFFKPLIMAWAKFSLMIWPVVKGLAAFKTIILSLQAIKGVAAGVTSLSAAMWKLNGAMTGGAVVGPVANGGKTLYGGPLGFLGGVTHAQKAKAMRGLELRRPHLMYADMGSPLEAEANAWNAAAVAQYKKHRKIYNRRLARAQAWNATKSVGGSLIGGLGISAGIAQITREDATTEDQISGGLYGAAGVAAMVGGPWGWGAAAVLGIAGGIMQYLGHLERVKQVVDGFKNFAESNKIANGVITNSSDTTMRYLNLIYNKQGDINGLIQERLDMTRELLGLKAQESINSASGAFKEKRENILDMGGQDKHNSLISMFSQWQSGNQLRLEHLTHGNYQYRVGSGDGAVTYNYRNPLGNLNKAFANDAAATFELMNGGFYTQRVSDVTAAIKRRLLLGQTKSEWNSYWDFYRSENDPTKLKGLIRPDQFNENQYELDNWSYDRMLHSFVARNEVWEQLEKAVEPMRVAIDNYLNAKESGNLTESHIVDLLQNGLIGDYSSYLTNYSPENIGNWYKTFGFWDGSFHEYMGGDAQTNAQTALKTMQDLQEALRLLKLDSSPAAESLMTFTNALIGQAQAFLGTGEDIVGEFDNQIKQFGNLTLQWDASKGVWNQIVNDNVLYVSTLSSNFGSLNNSIWNLGSTIGGYNWSGMWNSMLPHFNTTSFSGFSFVPGLNYNGSTLNTVGTFGNYNLGSFNSNWQVPSVRFNTGLNTGFNVLNTNRNFGRSQNRAISPLSYTPSQVGALAGYKSLNPITNTESDVHGLNGGKHDYNNDYKSNYKSNSAAPKQVIVNIENLMNVDKVDLSNADNQTVVTQLKEQMAQALIDVVHDFDETWHG